MKAEICPVCKGTGWASEQLTSQEGCHGCGGKGPIRGRGWVEVHEEPRGLDITYIPTVWEDFPNIPHSGTWHEEGPCLVYG